MSDNINIFPKADAIKPNYYRRKIKGVEIDIYDIARAFKMPNTLFNALKYIVREKGSTIQDYEKAIESIQREIQYLKDEALNG